LSSNSRTIFFVTERQHGAALQTQSGITT